MHIHILGICGTFMCSIAALAQGLGHRVTGSDLNIYPPMSDQLVSLGIKLSEGYDPNNLPSDIDLVIIGNAMSRGNDCVEYILNSKIPYISGPQWMYENVLKSKFVLAVSGTHGKTTTASMLTHILIEAGYKPGFLIGGITQNFGISASLGDSNYFVIEADEYDTAFFDKRSKFIHYSPDTLIINNLEFDHADIFDNLEEIKKQFHHLLRTLPSNGNIVFNAEDSNISDMMDLGCWSKKIGYSAKMQSEWQYILGNKHGSEFTIVDRSASVSKCNNTKVKWSNFGEHNVKNAVSASIASSLLGVNSQQISNALNTFKGVKRRMELIAKKGDINIYDDFAHHPTEIFSTLDSLRKKVGGEQIIAVIEPRSRTMKSGFHNKNLISSLLSADFVIWFEDSELNWSIENSLGEMTDKIFIEKSILGILTTLNRIKEQIANIVIMSNGDFSGLREIIADKID